MVRKYKPKNRYVFRSRAGLDEEAFRLMLADFVTLQPPNKTAERLRITRQTSSRYFRGFEMRLKEIWGDKYLKNRQADLTQMLVTLAENRSETFRNFGAEAYFDAWLEILRINVQTFLRARAVIVSRVSEAIFEDVHAARRARIQHIPTRSELDVTIRSLPDLSSAVAREWWEQKVVPKAAARLAAGNANRPPLAVVGIIIDQIARRYLDLVLVRYAHELTDDYYATELSEISKRFGGLDKSTFVRLYVIAIATRDYGGSKPLHEALLQSFLQRPLVFKESLN